MQNVPAMVQTSVALGGNHGKIYATHPSNIPIGNRPHLRAVAKKDYDKKIPPFGGIKFMVDETGLEPATPTM